MGKRLISYETVNLAESAMHFQVSKQLNWKKDEIPEVYPWYSPMLIGQLIHWL